MCHRKQSFTQLLVHVMNLHGVCGEYLGFQGFCCVVALIVQKGMREGAD